MHPVRADFVTKVKHGNVTSIGRSMAGVPRVRFGGKTMKWYEDKPKRVHKK